MMDVMEFVLDNTFIQDLDGNIWQQKLGIPMGDPHSPGMTIGACAWMEMEWLASLSADVKSSFRAARYMDDILMLFAKHATGLTMTHFLMILNDLSVTGHL